MEAIPFRDFQHFFKHPRTQIPLSCQSLHDKTAWSPSQYKKYLNTGAMLIFYVREEKTASSDPIIEFHQISRIFWSRVNE